MTCTFPDEVAGPYDPPPTVFTDRDGRRIEVRQYDGGIEPLVDMYQRFDPEDRAQGIPPTSESQIKSWLEKLLEDDCVNVVAFHGEEPIGHAILVPDGSEAYELAIFVLGAYQDAGIGTGLIKALLGLGRTLGIEHAWLTVERWNKPAAALYRNVGFVPTDDGSFELEMSATLLADD